MSVLVTGSAGFIGSNFVLDWMAQCDEPVINPDALNAGNLENLASMQGDGRHTFVKDRPGHDRRYAIDAGKLERELGWKPAETSETGIRKTVRWYLGSQEWVRNVTSGECRNWVETQNAIEAPA